MAKRKPAGRKRKAAGRTRKAVRARKVAAPRRGARKAARKPAAKAVAKKSARKAVPKKKAATRKTAPRKAAPRKAAPAKKVTARKPPALNRARRTIAEESVVPSPPSSLDLDRTASAVRTGRRELHEKLTEHTETSPAITGGDIDADWESAYSVGDEAPGGDNPTPDQDIVDDIGRAVGVEYEDNEELKGEAKVSDRDRHKWELDPASSEDYKDR
jgi:hypothetical protein